MARPKEVMDDELASAADAALRQISDHQLCFRLQAIMACARHPLHVVASVMGVNVTTLWRWAKRFREEGVQGLRDRPKGHNPSKLNSQQQYSIATWLDTGKNMEGCYTLWTIPLLQEEVHRVFGIHMGRTPLRLLVRKMEFRLKVPRPKHYKTNPSTQEAFKKNS